ncbi:MAG: hypothetical protein A2499_05805 [Stygiobacter sp. RIFOXYC12_FULL_38_8]|nr:MAG: hypothetical protein A2299_09100 [Stygiobacter sp. RIFOXYB2_FULL_37_11]OGV09844.1 MAG: hypothetical protein A2237_03160 [Stygiobacter sp. RIFOXYA2_FULL_38_8]OGV15714.1 MAG: hypothetical protein A2440_01530 [Stygiobacter sp. RIFOXYC2_FULL_38_25]OGV22744.1 MAG: hypothetical protein A2499_05805 [Stygiobacter sp. RIFOXYC12_FULL_38_8]OGV80828.1 MAG: hypothetical protein A2X65_06580 [Stygiobacter sp. GWF2_38_21]RJQ63589.1 MAG: hypothetical protein C4517_04210 [Stygiobacter sp.]
MFKKLFCLMAAVLFILSFSVKAQSLEETLSKLSSTAGKSYVAPVISAFGSNLNSGWVSQVPSATRVGFHLDVKIAAMGSFFSDENKNFNTSGKFFFTSSQVDQILASSGVSSTNPQYASLKNELMKTELEVNFSGPTIVGSKNEYLKINFPGKTVQGVNLAKTNFDVTAVKGFLDELPVFPTAAPQLTVGTVMGTNVSFRYLPDVDIEDMGKFTFFGIGAIHNPGVWFPNPLPVDIGVGYFTQKMKVGDIFESTANQFGLYVSKTFGLVISITPYAGLVSENSKTTVSYDYQSNETVNGVQVPKTKLSFELEGENTTGFVVGFTLHLAAVNINADYKVAKTKTASAGISFGF